jgi:hypothetical protein
VLPHHEVRSFATWFYQFKNNLLASDLRASGQHPAAWEKKGTELFTTNNTSLYPNLSSAANRLINRIYKCNGRIFYYGRRKYQSPEKSKANGLYATVISAAVRNLDRFAELQNKFFMMILDEHTDRLMLLESAAKTMFGNNRARRLIEPPFQVESHLYQTIQAADWIATLVGRVLAFRTEPIQYADWNWAEQKFGTKIDAYSTHSQLWRPPEPPEVPIAVQSVAVAAVATVTLGSTSKASQTFILRRAARRDAKKE